MSEMVERVREAILAAMGDKVLLDDGEETLIDGYIDSTAVARAAIEALRDPTDDMMKAGIDQADDCTDGGTVHAACIPEHVWPKMIDAALA